MNTIYQNLKKIDILNKAIQEKDLLFVNQFLDEIRDTPLRCSYIKKKECLRLFVKHFYVSSCMDDIENSNRLLFTFYQVLFHINDEFITNKSRIEELIRCLIHHDIFNAFTITFQTPIENRISICIQTKALNDQSNNCTIQFYGIDKVFPYNINYISFYTIQQGSLESFKQYIIKFLLEPMIQHSVIHPNYSEQLNKYILKLLCKCIDLGSNKICHVLCFDLSISSLLQFTEAIFQKCITKMLHYQTLNSMHKFMQESKLQQFKTSCLKCFQTICLKFLQTTNQDCTKQDCKKIISYFEPFTILPPQEESIINVGYDMIDELLTHIDDNSDNSNNCSLNNIREVCTYIAKMTKKPETFNIFRFFEYCFMKHNIDLFHQDMFFRNLIIAAYENGYLNDTPYFIEYVETSLYNYNHTCEALKKVNTIPNELINYCISNYI